jgi:hypothetical protein
MWIYLKGSDRIESNEVGLIASIWISIILRSDSGCACNYSLSGAQHEYALSNLECALFSEPTTSYTINAIRVWGLCAGNSIKRYMDAPYRCRCDEVVPIAV